MKKLLIISTVVLISNSLNAQTVYFPPLTGSTWDTISPQSLNWCQHRIDSLYAFLDANNTKAFILLKDGKIVLEKYFDGHTQTSIWQWASAGKTITSFMIGIAQQEGYLSITDTSSGYLGQGWTSCAAPDEEKITIRHQLTMTSGLDDNVPNHFCTTDTCLVCLQDPGTRWAYHNGPYTLLSNVIENATGSTLNSYTTQKLKNPTGMTGAFVPVGFNNVFYSNARTMARFGLLILNHGNWNGNQLMTDTAYFGQMVNSSQALNPAYGYLWWLNGKTSYMVPGSQFTFNGPINTHAPDDAIAAMGKGGQCLNIAPGQNLVWVRMGNAPDEVPVPFLINDMIWEYLNQLECITWLNELSGNHDAVQLFPNPVINTLHIQSGNIILKLEILNLQGRLIKSLKPQTKEISISLGDLSQGIYIVKAELSGGVSWFGKLIKE